MHNLTKPNATAICCEPSQSPAPQAENEPRPPAEETHAIAPEASASKRTKSEEQSQNRLVQVRLGIASSLYLSLRAKHPPSAAHSLRVALICSSWSALLNLDERDRDLIEVAALLHDIGKIGIPDQILLKPERLSTEESKIMNRHRLFAREILSSCCASSELWEIVYSAPAWYNGRLREFDRKGDGLPLGARILAIADAYDSMTVDHIYRRAMSREQASSELAKHADTQFDPHLVKQFTYFLRCNHAKLNALVARRWLQDLRKSQDNRHWLLSSPAPGGSGLLGGSVFHEQLLENMHDGVVFVSSDLRILKWNRAIEILTGIPSSRAEQQPWDPALLQMRDENYKLIPLEKCPVIQAVRGGESARQRVLVCDMNQKKISIDAYASPVVGADGSVQGATLLLEDASSRVSLEERLQSLNERATHDGLTGIANRAEFDRTHARWIESHLESGTPYSLVICDLDLFKRINDNFGHPAGDEALVTFASLLRSYCRPNDFVARYGGEEFVLCTECDNGAATVRAENIREAWARLAHPMLQGRCLTASFGVTELQRGDTGESMLRRADRALLQAKADGRNAVVQRGSGMTDKGRTRFRRHGWFRWWRDKPCQQLLQQRVVTAVPISLAAEKLRGFVVDHEAEVVEISDDCIIVEIGGNHVPMMRRSTDRSARFVVELQLDEINQPSESRPESTDLLTVIQVTIRPKRQRDRQHRNADRRARQLLSSIKSYLMAQDFEPNRE